MARQVAIDEVCPIPSTPAESWLQFFKKRQLLPVLQIKKRSPWQVQQFEELRHGVTARRAHEATSTSCRF